MKRKTTSTWKAIRQTLCLLHSKWGNQISLLQFAGSRLLMGGGVHSATLDVWHWFAASSSALQCLARLLPKPVRIREKPFVCSSFNKENYDKTDHIAASTLTFFLARFRRPMSFLKYKIVTGQSPLCDLQTRYLEIMKRNDWVCDR